MDTEKDKSTREMMPVGKKLRDTTWDDYGISRHKGLSLYGKSTQVKTTGAQLFDFGNAMQKKYR